MLSKDERAAIRERRTRAIPDAARVWYSMDFTHLVDFDVPALLTALDEQDAVIARLVGALQGIGEDAQTARLLHYAGGDEVDVDLDAIRDTVRVTLTPPSDAGGAKEQE